MEGSSFHNQLLSVMDVLAKAAVAEIHRRVDDSCAVLRVEVSQSRRDIDLLRRKCEGMEAELRRTRIRARRKVFHPPAAHRFSPLVRVVVNTETQTTDWDGQTEFAELEPTDNAEEALVKMECSEEMWKNHSEDKMKSDEEQPSCLQVFHPTQTVGFVEPHSSAENQADPGSIESPTRSYNNARDQSEVELPVKHEREEELHEDPAALDSVGHFETEEGNGHLWTSGQWIEDADPCSSYAGQQFSSVLPSQSGLHLDVVPQIQTTEKSQAVSASAASVKRCIRTFGSKTQDEGNSSPQFSSMDSSVILHPPCRDKGPHTGHQNMTVIPQIQASTSSSHGYSSISSVLARRIRTPWRSAMKEKKFSCSFCSRTFYKRCQLNEHLRSHTGERPFSCKLCGRSFAKQCNLIRHAVVHSGERPHKCSLCGKCFTQRSSLKSHQKTAH